MCNPDKKAECFVEIARKIRRTEIFSRSQWRRETGLCAWVWDITVAWRPASGHWL